MIVILGLYKDFTLFASYNRCVFLDFPAALLLFSAVVLNTPQLTKPFALKVFAGIGLAIAIDVAWLVLYTTAWWRTGYNDSYSLLNVRRTVLVFTYVLMLVRLLVLIAFGVSFSELPTGEDEFFLEGTRRSGGQAYRPFDAGNYQNF